MISEISYNFTSRLLRVEHKDCMAYTHADVPEAVFKALVAASNKEQHYDKHILDHFKIVQSSSHIADPSSR